MENSKKSDIIEFYMGYCTDCQNRMINEIWSWDSIKLENTHDFIQWLFPLNEKSHYSYSAPVLEANQIETFRNSKELKSNLKVSFKAMLNFYGFTDIDKGRTGIIIKKTANFDEVKTNWLNENNHNYLRITRILKCLKLLGLEEYALSFYNCLEEVYKDEESNIGAITFSYWRNAVT